MLSRAFFKAQRSLALPCDLRQVSLSAKRADPGKLQ
jgi:hypothetical protein